MDDDATHFHFEQYQPGNGKTGDPVNGKEDEQPLPYVRMDTWDAEPPPPREWLVQERIPQRNVTLLSGEGSAGKSLLMLQLAVAMVLGRGWLDMVPEVGGALYISCEDDEDEIRRRLAPILTMHGATYADLIKGGFHLLCFTGEDAISRRARAH